MVDVEVRITSMQGTHTFRRDRTCQIIKCNPWSARLYPHPIIIKKMKTYLELEESWDQSSNPINQSGHPTQNKIKTFTRRHSREHPPTTQKHPSSLHYNKQNEKHPQSSQLMLASHGPKQEKCWGTSLN